MRRPLVERVDEWVCDRFLIPVSGVYIRQTLNSLLILSHAIPIVALSDTRMLREIL